MDREKLELIIAPLLVIIAVIFIFSTVKKVMRQRPYRTAAVSKVDIEIPSSLEISPVSGTEPLSFKETTQDFFKEEKSQIKYNVEDLDWGRDPFVLDKTALLGPEVDPTHMAKFEQLSRLKLTGILISPDEPQDSIAVINGENFKLGEMISGFRIKEIKSNYLILRWGEDFILRLWEEEEAGKEAATKRLP